MKQQVTVSDTGVKNDWNLVTLSLRYVSSLVRYGNVSEKQHDPEEQIPFRLIICKWFTRSRHRGDSSTGPWCDLNTRVREEMDLSRNLPTNRLPFIFHGETN